MGLIKNINISLEDIGNILQGCFLANLDHDGDINDGDIFYSHPSIINILNQLTISDLKIVLNICPMAVLFIDPKIINNELLKISIKSPNFTTTIIEKMPYIDEDLENFLLEERGDQSFYLFFNKNIKISDKLQLHQLQTHMESIRKDNLIYLHEFRYLYKHKPFPPGLINFIKLYNFSYHFEQDDTGRYGEHYLTRN